MVVYPIFLLKVLTNRLISAITLMLLISEVSVNLMERFLDIKNMFCRQGARSRSKHDVNMTLAPL